MSGLARLYGSRPRHLAAVLLAFALGAYGWVRIAQHGHLRDVVIWFVGAILAHDIVLFPLYRLAYEVARRSRVPALAHLVVPAAASGLLLGVWLPLILQPGRSAARFKAITGVSSDPYLARWALITAGLFAASAAVYAARALRARR